IFLRSLPANAHHRSVFWVVPSGRGLRLSQTNNGPGVKIGGLDRLTLLKDIASLADELKIYAHPTGESSEWELRCGGLLFRLTITAEPSRGFSGEGQVLSDLSTADPEHISKVRSQLKWQSAINMNELARDCSMTPDTVRQSLSLLGSRGLVGYDLTA